MNTSVMRKVASGLLAVSMLTAGSAALAEGTAEAGQTVSAVEETAQSFSFSDLSGLMFEFSSGAGAWSTELQIAPDGSFTGNFHDGEMGDTGETYPNGSVYGCSFHGQLSLGEQVNDYTLKLNIDSLELDEGQLAEVVEDGIRYVTSDPYGLTGASELLLYLPGAPVAELPEEYMEWAHLAETDENAAELPFYGLYNEAEQDGFVSYELSDEVDTAGSATLEPTHEMNMDTYGTEDCTVAASFTSDDINENNVLAYTVYGADLYDTDKVLALQPGDNILANDSEATVSTVETVDGGVDINGGFFNENGEEGISLVYVDGDPDHMVSMQYDDQKAMTVIGQAAYPLADEVTVRCFTMTDDGEFTGAYVEATLPASEVKAYLAELENNDITFAMSSTTVTLKDGKVSEIFVDWTPNA